VKEGEDFADGSVFGNVVPRSPPWAIDVKVFGGGTTIFVWTIVT
jgi:hypothetical protein